MQFAIPATRGLVLSILITAAAPASAQSARERAETLLLVGRYEEAYQAFQALDKNDALAVLGAARARAAVGKRREAEELLTQAISRLPKSAVILAERAGLLLLRGEYDQAQKDAERALVLNNREAASLWVLAELHRVHGRLEEAEAAYQKLADLPPPQGGERAAETICWIGRATAQIARWTRKSQQFSGLVNRTFPSALQLNSNYWPAHLETARLFAEKFNDAAATTELNSALAINPQAAEAHALRAELALAKFDLPTARRAAERALSLNPRLAEAHQAQADVLIAERQVPRAIDALKQALLLNPSSEEILGRLAGAYLLRDGQQASPETAVGQLLQQAEQRNPHCGLFHAAVADTLDRLQRFPAAADYYREALRRLPRMIGVRGKLGLMLMRLGEEAEAAKLLQESFDIDPFNVRVKNMLAVLDLLQGYAVVETEHFVLRFDRGSDQMLADYAARYLEEEVYPELVKKLGFEPREKSLFEIFSRSAGTSGHGWFSARMVGLPFVGTVGACAGKMVAIASPNDMPQKFNWARVLKHEFVHVVNLQQTDFNVPRWFTEGLAVWHEDFPRPAAWNTILARRLEAEKLFDLDSIDYGFARPGNGEDWTLAYCQAELYVEYLITRYGNDSIAKMLEAYGANLGTAAALKRCFQLDADQFEDGYREFLQTVVAASAAPSGVAPRSFAELQRAAREHPDDPDALADLAYAYLQRKSNPQARKYALQARKLQPRHAQASYVLARLYLSIGDVDLAKRILLEALDAESPPGKVVSLLAGLYYRERQYAEAARLYQRGLQTHPGDDQWLKALARVYLAADNDEQLRPILEQLADVDTDNASLCEKLARLALKEKDFQAVAKWARRGVHIDVGDANLHALWAQALTEMAKHGPAIREFEAAVQLDPRRLVWRFSLADVCVQAKQFDKAKQVLTELQELDPDYPGADLLLENLPK